MFVAWPFQLPFAKATGFVETALPLSFVVQKHRKTVALNLISQVVSCRAHLLPRCSYVGVLVPHAHPLTNVPSYSLLLEGLPFTVRPGPHPRQLLHLWVACCANKGAEDPVCFSLLWALPLTLVERTGVCAGSTRKPHCCCAFGGSMTGNVLVTCPIAPPTLLFFKGLPRADEFEEMWTLVLSL